MISGTRQPSSFGEGLEDADEYWQNSQERYRRADPEQHPVYEGQTGDRLARWVGYQQLADAVRISY